MSKTTWKTRFKRFKNNMKETIDSPATYIIGGLGAVNGYLETGSIKGAVKNSANVMGGFIVTNGVVGTVIDEISDKLED